MSTKNKKKKKIKRGKNLIPKSKEPASNLYTRTMHLPTMSRKYCSALQFSCRASSCSFTFNRDFTWFGTWYGLLQKACMKTEMHKMSAKSVFPSRNGRGIGKCRSPFLSYECDTECLSQIMIDVITWNKLLCFFLWSSLYISYEEFCFFFFSFFF